jgi:hypothetical protein
MKRAVGTGETLGEGTDWMARFLKEIKRQEKGLVYKQNDLLYR